MADATGAPSSQTSRETATTILPSWTTREEQLPLGAGHMVSFDPVTSKAAGETPLRSLQVRAVVIGSLARTEVNENFQNPEQRQLEATFTYLLPQGARLSRIATRVGNKTIDGGVFDEDRISLIPQGLIRRGWELGTPESLDGRGGELLQLQVFPLAPNATRNLLLAYDESFGGNMTHEVYRYPMSWGTTQASKLDYFSIEVTLAGPASRVASFTTPGFDSTISRDSDRVVVTFKSAHYVPVQDFVIEAQTDGLPEPEILADVPKWPYQPIKHPLLNTPVSDSIASIDDDSAIGHFTLLFRTRPPSLPGTVRFGRRIVIIDKSYGQSEASLDIQRKIAESLLEGVQSSGSLMFLACDSDCVSWSSGGRLPVNGEVRASAKVWLNHVAPSGTFDLEGAFAHALVLLQGAAPSQVVYLGDGRPTSGERRARPLHEQIVGSLAAGGVDLRIVGVGRRIDRDMLLALATRADSTFDIVTNTRIAAMQIRDIVAGLCQPKITNVRVVLPDGAFDVSPSRFPALHPGQSVRIAGRLKSALSGDARLIGRLKGNDFTASYPITLTPETIVPNPLVSRLWAHTYIRDVESAISPEPAFGATELARLARVRSSHTNWMLLQNSTVPTDRRLPKTRPAGALPLPPRGMMMPSGIISWFRENGTKERSEEELTLRGMVELGPVSPETVSQDIRSAIGAMRATARQCYSRFLTSSGNWLEGRLNLMARFAPNGTLESLVAGADRNLGWDPLVQCLRWLAAEHKFRTPKTEAAVEAKFAADFRIDWERGLVLDAMLSNGIGWTRRVSVRIDPSDERWRTSVIGHQRRCNSGDAIGPESENCLEARRRSILGMMSPEQAVSAALELVQDAPNYPPAYELLAALAEANKNAALRDAAFENLLALVPDDETARQVVAAMYIGQADDRRASAHLHAISPDYRSEPPRSNPACLPFAVSVSCQSAGKRCPMAVAVSPTYAITWPIRRLFTSKPSETSTFRPWKIGDYHVALLGGDEGTTGLVRIDVLGTSRSFAFEKRHAIQTIAKVALSPEAVTPASEGVPICVQPSP